jgi:UDP-N-acetylmuramoylalanine--D-glutamate ligase
VLGTDAAFHLAGGELVFSDWNLRFPTREMKLTGRHMMANALAAVGSALLMGVQPDLVGPVLRDFGGLPHRMSYCGEVRGVRYYDDSKATNVGSVEGSLAGWGSPYVLLLGGRHKGAPYAPLIPVLQKGCRAVVVLGESAALIRADLERDLPVHDAASFDDAVRLAARLAQPGDAVILSPACSSYDMFENYKQRGDRFAALVGELK